MELALNLAWLLLAVPAYWLWRRGEGARSARSVSALQFVLALGCVLVLLFPVISATDDVHAMRAEMEDSTISKRAVRQAGHDKASAGITRVQGPALAAASASVLPGVEARTLEGASDVLPMATARVLRAGRAPPSSISFPG